MNEKEKAIYNEIKRELSEVVIDKKKLRHYYNVGMKIMEIQGDNSRAKYGDMIIKKYSLRLTKKLGKGYSTRTLKYMRIFYLLKKRQPLDAQFVSWSHYCILLSIKDANEINYYINETIRHHLSKRKLQEKIKNKEYQRLSIETKNKIINKHEDDKYLIEYSSDKRIRITSYELKEGNKYVY